MKAKTTTGKAARPRTAAKPKRRPAATPKLTAKLIRIGKSRGLRLPKALIEQAKLGDEVELSVRGDELVVRTAGTERKPRAGWEEQIKAVLAKHGDDIEEWREWQAMPNKFDEEEWTW